jgi:hypothetical protein
MKKLKQTFRQLGDDFEKATAKELLHYATLINKLQIKRYFLANYKIVKMGCILIIVSLCLTSCATQKGIAKKETANKEIPERELLGLNKGFSGSFSNIPFSNNSKCVQNSLLSLLEIKPQQPENELMRLSEANPNLINDSIEMEIQKNGDLKVNYVNENGEKDSNIFKGKKRKKDYKLFLQKERTFVLPILWTTNVERLNISLTKDSTLVVKKYSNHSAMFLFMAGGYGGDFEYCFKNMK